MDYKGDKNQIFNQNLKIMENFNNKISHECFMFYIDKAIESMNDQPKLKKQLRLIKDLENDDSLFFKDH